MIKPANTPFDTDFDRENPDVRRDRDAGLSFHHRSADADPGRAYSRVRLPA